MKNEFTIEGIVRYKPKGIGLKVETVEGKYKTTHEILCFKGEASGLDEGDEVTITGNLGTKKSGYVRNYNGKDYPVYLTQLIAREVKKHGAFATQKKRDMPPADDDLGF
jgi:hypothetical protein